LTTLPPATTSRPIVGTRPGFPLTAAPAAVTARGGYRLRHHLRDPPSHPGGH